MRGVCLIIGAQCGFFLVSPAARDERESLRATLVGQSILPRQQHPTGVGSLQDSWRYAPTATEHTLCGPR